MKWSHISKENFCITLFLFLEDAVICVAVAFLVEYVLGPVLVE